jgi:pyridoxal phosphate enzyme (YggS family)
MPENMAAMSTSARQIRDNLDAIHARIQAAATGAGRSADEIRLIAVSKYMPAEAVQQAMAAGQFCFGENFVQDAQTKQALLDDPRNEWHFIGHLQTNKARLIPGNFDWLHTLDSLKLAGKLSASAATSQQPLNVLLQVNIAGDPDKHGLPGNTVFQFTESLLEAGLHGIKLRGLMTIGRQQATTDQRRADFLALRELSEGCAQRFGRQYFTQLSMGMSDDFELAISAGATMVRVGSAIFGERPRAAP